MPPRRHVNPTTVSRGNLVSPDLQANSNSSVHFRCVGEITFRRRSPPCSGPSPPLATAPVRLQSRLQFHLKISPAIFARHKCLLPKDLQTRPTGVEPATYGLEGGCPDRFIPRDGCCAAAAGARGRFPAAALRRCVRGCPAPRQPLLCRAPGALGPRSSRFRFSHRGLRGVTGVVGEGEIRETGSQGNGRVGRVDAVVVTGFQLSMPIWLGTKLTAGPLHVVS